mgnify:CR=1 FL=1
MICLGLTGCNAVNPIKLLGGKPVGVNAQLGKENEQVIGVKTEATYGNNSYVAPVSTSVRPVSRPSSVNQVQAQENNVKADTVENITVHEVPPWIVLVALLGWLLPTPSQIGSSFINLFKRRKR